MFAPLQKRASLRPLSATEERQQQELLHSDSELSNEEADDAHHRNRYGYASESAVVRAIGDDEEARIERNIRSIEMRLDDEARQFAARFSHTASSILSAVPESAEISSTGVYGPFLNKPKPSSINVDERCSLPRLPGEPIEFTRLRSNAYDRCWAAILTAIENVISSSHSPLFEALLRYIFDVQAALFSLLPAAILGLGHSFDDRSSLFDRLSNHIASYRQTHNRDIIAVARLKSSDCSSLKGTLMSTLLQLTGSVDVVDMRGLERWTSQHQPHYDRLRMLIIFEDALRFDPEVLNDFLVLCSEYISSLPFVLLFGVSYALETTDPLNSVLSYDSRYLLLPQNFYVPSNASLVDRIIKEIFITELDSTQFSLGPDALGFMLDQFQNIHDSLDLFIHSLKFAVLDHFMHTPLSFLSHSKASERFAEFIQSEFFSDAYLKVLFDFAEPNEDSDSAPVLTEVEVSARYIDGDHKLTVAGGDLLKSFVDYRRRFLAVVKCLSLLRLGLAKLQEKPMVEFVYCDTLLEAIRDPRLFTDDFQTFIDMTSKDDSVVRDLIVEWSQILESVGLSNESKQLAKLRWKDGRGVNVVSTILTATLKPMHSQTAWKIFVFNNRKRLEDALNPNLRKAVVSALKGALEAEVKSTAAEGHPDQTLDARFGHSLLLDAAILYDLYSDCQRYVNLADLRVQFSDEIIAQQNASNEKIKRGGSRVAEDNKEFPINARFIQAVREFLWVGLLDQPLRFRGPDVLEKVFGADDEANH